MENSAQELIGRFETWARQQHDIYGVFLVGGHGQGRAKPWSDVDLAFVTTQPKRYAQPDAWLGAMGTLWTAIYVYFFLTLTGKNAIDIVPPEIWHQ